VASDGKAWLVARRLRTPVSALDRLIADHAALADKIRSAKSWPEVADQARADRSRPGTSDLRLARLLGDSALEARARALPDARTTQLALELTLVFDPGGEVNKADLALLDAR